MTERELKNLYLETEHGTFTPHYTYDDFIIDENTKEGVYINLVIEKTAQEVYDKWLYDRDNPPTQEADKMEVLQKENKQLWDTVEFLLKANGNIPNEVN